MLLISSTDSLHNILLTTQYPHTWIEDPLICPHMAASFLSLLLTMLICGKQTKPFQDHQPEGLAYNAAKDQRKGGADA